MGNFQFPQHFRYIIPLVKILKDIGGSGRSSEVIDLIVEKLGISDKELLDTNKNGQPKILMQIYWAKLFLVKTGYLSSPKRGVWSLTEKGLNFDFSNENLINLHSQNRGWRYQWFKP
jgi:restriction system protein